MTTNKHIYVLSTGRTGTTFLYKFFNTHYPGLNITHQTRWSRLLNIAGNLPLRLKHKARLIQWLFKKLKKQTIPQSTVDPLLSLPIKILIDAGKIPDYKIIHLVRDPRTFVPSFMNWKIQSFKRTLLHHLVPFWQPSPFWSGETGFFKSLFMPKYEHFCWVWQYKNTLFNSYRNKEHYLLLKTEDFKGDKLQSGIQQMITFLELSIKEIDYGRLQNKKDNVSKKSSFPAWNAWPPGMKQKMKDYCGELAVELGYDY